MITQMTARPDPDGVIRVRCGEDMIEITLDPAIQQVALQEERTAPGSSKKAAPAPEKPTAAPPDRSERRWSKLPDWKRTHTFFSVGLECPVDASSPGYLNTATTILVGVAAARADAARKNPEAILLQVKGGLDIHGINDLSKAISTKNLDLPIFIEFERP